jgi:hypothetical protein
LQTARLKPTGILIFCTEGKPGNANPAGDPESPEQRERNKPRTDSLKPAKCGRFTNGLLGTYPYGESQPGREGFPRATLYSIQPMEDAYSRAKEYGHSKLSVFPWEH